MIGGSSPRAWGTRVDGYYHFRINRFIPTGVGNSAGFGARIGIYPVHPHGRGELDSGNTKSRVHRGSSPRAWGTRARPGRARRPRRFIPTGVGNSGTSIPARTHLSVHPHGRGELGVSIALGHEGLGSSPRAWGTRCCDGRGRRRFRFIPTGVGNSCTDKHRCRMPPVHPHGRGELAARCWRFRHAGGSSPRAWGTLAPPR